MASIPSSGALIGHLVSRVEADLSFLESHNLLTAAELAQIRSSLSEAQVRANGAAMELLAIRNDPSRADNGAGMLPVPATVASPALSTASSAPAPAPAPKPRCKAIWDYNKAKVSLIPRFSDSVVDGDRPALAREAVQSPLPTPETCCGLLLDCVHRLILESSPAAGRPRLQGRRHYPDRGAFCGPGHPGGLSPRRLTRAQHLAGGGQPGLVARIPECVLPVAGLPRLGSRRKPDPYRLPFGSSR